MAWKDYDVAVHHAAFYSWLARIFQAILLLLSVVIIVFTVLYTQRCDEEYASDYVAEILSSLNVSISDSNIDGCLQIPMSNTQIEGTIFGLSLAMSFVLSLDAYLIPSSRASHLKSGAAELESIIWLYRAPTGIICAVFGWRLGHASHFPSLALDVTRLPWGYSTCASVVHVMTDGTHESTRAADLTHLRFLYAADLTHSLYTRRHRTRRVH